MEPSEDAENIDLKGGNMSLNRFSIDEDAGFELSGVCCLKKSSKDLALKKEFKLERESKGKGYVRLK